MVLIPKDWPMYIKTGIFGALVFGACYAYTRWLGIPGELNKSAADAAIILIGLSMLISSVSYYFNFLDWSVAYRKHLGLIGFAFALAHLYLSWNPFLALFRAGTWESGRQWPVLTGVVALGIFSGMALISNSVMARGLGRHWRPLLRVGYAAVLLILAHVWLLKSGRWITWYEEGMQSPPSLSLIAAVFMVIVIVMRIGLWFSLRRNTHRAGAKRL